jgi:hypothetical protein
MPMTREQDTLGIGAAAHVAVPVDRFGNGRECAARIAIAAALYGAWIGTERRGARRARLPASYVAAGWSMRRTGRPGAGSSRRLTSGVKVDGSL